MLKSEFSKNVSSQILGTGIAQALPFLATPVLTRLYTESDFAAYTSFFAIATIFAVAVGGKYQMAIVLPKSAKEALRLFTLSLYITFAYSLLLALLTILFYDFIDLNIGQLIYLVPLYVLFFGIWSAFINLSIREKTFKVNAYAKVLQSVGYILTAIGLGIAKIALYGLVLAKVTGTLFSWGYLFKKSLVKARVVPVRKLKEVAKKYIDYPKYGVGPAFLNTISSQALILILSKYYTTDDLGHFGLTFMVLSAPLTLIGTSFKDVFYQRIASLISSEKYKEALSFFKKSAWSLLVMGIPICAILYFFGEPIFSLVFGERWSRSGVFASILAASFLMKLVVSPLSSVFNATNRLKVAMVWQVTYFITTFLTLGLCATVFNFDVEQLFYVFVVHEIVLYSLYYGLQYRTMRKFYLDA
ncbi:lipopolysaccharide biosynthesis protein [Muriicola sp. Z0-33]|uniref:lipopolysaccharide biosynthesis protein n=1 Tax=Muriicola sp. Z0-33 TaxID=2816957 RepID=UPI002238FE92|nr:oligosaccharide flippase family protein [Muriicola sp. Z0-33]MCW5514646.1 oligosaccharide flippase family protein [Muriicola sp. Z0-33]